MVDKQLVRALFFAAGLVILLWFLNQIVEVLLLFFLALILAVVMNAPVTWLEHKGLKRSIGTLLVSSGVVVVLGLIGWLVVPRLVDQFMALVQNLPTYAELLANRTSRLVGDYPTLTEHIRVDANSLARMVPSFPTLLQRFGRYSLSLLEIVALTIVVFSMVIYMVGSPRPLLELYIETMPVGLRERSARAFARASDMIVGWMWSNMIVGAIEAVAAGLFLTYLGIPGAIVWASLTFFAELVPRLGPYLMAIPPTLVALSVDPLNALWVVLFYVALNELSGNIVMPYVRGSTMQIHPVSILFAVLAMATAFGFLGALIATPMAAIVKAYYEEFYLSRQPHDEQTEQRVEQIVERDAPHDSA